MTERQINRCFCGAAFPHAFSPDWEKAVRHGVLFAHCVRCGREHEVFSHGRGQYWIWPMERELDAV
jgi:hypothetical protein